MVREAAAEVLRTGAAQLTSTTVKELYGPGSAYDAPVVILTPRNPRAARVVIEGEEDAPSWLTAADGPGVEFYEDDSAERLRQLSALVTAVIGGGYEDEWRIGRRRRFLRPWRWREVPEWAATFHTAAGPVSTHHFGVQPAEDVPRARRFEPY